MKFKLVRRNRAIERQRRAGNRSRSQRTVIQPRRAILQPRGIAQQHLHIRLQPMRHQHRLRALQMRIARHHRIAGRVRQLNQRISPCRQPFNDQPDLFAHIQAQVRRNLLVAAAPRMQLQPQRIPLRSTSDNST